MRGNTHIHGVSVGELSIITITIIIYYYGYEMKSFEVNNLGLKFGFPMSLRQCLCGSV